MEIVVLSENTTKIIISKRELENLDISFDDLKEGGLKARLFFSSLFQSLGETFSEKAFVEIFNLADGSCVIYVSRVQRNKPRRKFKSEKCVVETNNPAKLSRVSTRLLQDLKSDFKSMLYTDGESFRLVIELNEEALELAEKISAENYVRFQQSALTASLTSEHSESWKLIIPENAVQILSEAS